MIERLKELYNEKVKHIYLLKNKKPIRSQPVVFQRDWGIYATYHIYATYDDGTNMWTGHSGITDGVCIPADPYDRWWEF